MTELSSIWLKSRPFETLSCRGLLSPHCVPCVGLLRFNLSRLIENQSYFKLEPIFSHAGMLAYQPQKLKKIITEEENKLINNVAVGITSDSKAAMIVVLTDEGTCMTIAGNKEYVSKMKERIRRCLAL